MYPADFDESNDVLMPPPGHDDLLPLSVMRATMEGTDKPVVISCWKLTQDELDEVNRTGRVWAMVCDCGRVPPMRLGGYKPWERSQDDI